MSMMPARISTGSAPQPSINFFRSGSSCATGRCHPAASAPHSAPRVLETSLFPVVSFVSSSPVSPIEMNARGCAGSQELARPRCVFRGSATSVRHGHLVRTRVMHPCPALRLSQWRQRHRAVASTARPCPWRTVCLCMYRNQRHVQRNPVTFLFPFTLL